jgi:hypothetical protein
MKKSKVPHDFAFDLNKIKNYFEWGLLVHAVSELFGWSVFFSISILSKLSLC